MIGAEIRVATRGDLPVIAWLDAQIFGSSAYSDEQWQSEIQSDAVTIYLAITDGSAVGFCSAARAGDDYEIHKIGVLTAHRRRGLANELLRLTESQISGGRCLIEVAAQNISAVRFYAKAGFSEFARRKRYYANGDDAILMQKFLSVL
ncbi:GNAT family N-acetyltransferase [Turneriella parva]|uniref:GCN5-related N-acetyltransferase n=1 Tax=Turneriella parva (strain ATCC BAA-1111 / DSM 21527 / NCTC 11395 / H) TaxID=869212 RepID=I4B2B7_TURPD|nr:GNAT family N-acetyltransferase [Turneriella parva]AFM11424.1 GCN5-related N-acetyltransferase [Turneriella parva DSM 21527]